MEFLRTIWKALEHLLSAVTTALPELIGIIAERIRQICERERLHGGKTPVNCLPVPPGVFHRPDASIYSQVYLMSLGMAVTWDNPDIELTDLGGSFVGSHDLQPATDYRIRAAIHNRSNDAPAPGMVVNFTLYSFGVGGVLAQKIGTDIVNLPVRGAPGEPALASVTWKTPAAPGHYCVQVDAVWPDDANPLDNSGQENTVIKRARPGERLDFRIPVRNTLQGTRLLRVHLNSYELPRRPIMRPTRFERSEARGAAGGGERGEREQRNDFLQRIIDANAEELYPAPHEWSPELSERRLVLESDQTRELLFSVTVPENAPAGSEQRFNLAVADDAQGQLVGGVTVICVSS